MDPNAPAAPIFISYAHRDNEGADAGRRWLDRLMEHLEPLARQNQVAVWSDREIEAGEEWHDRIREALERARAAVLLVSPAFLASEYIRSSELPVLLKRARDRGVVIIPIHLRTSVYDRVRFRYPDPVHGPEEFSLASLQAANSPEEPLNGMEEHEQDRVLVSVARRLLSIVAGEEAPAAAGTREERDVPPPGAGPGEPEPDEGRRRSRSVSDALWALAEMMDAPEVRDAVTTFRTNFEAASQQIVVLKQYKDLHDQLHTLQFQCYERILGEANRFPEDETARDNLEDHEQTLLATLGKIRGAPGPFDAAWMVRDLEAAHQELRAALEVSDRVRLRRAASLLDRVLNVYPPRLNTRLTETAKSLRLPSLVGAMTVIRDRLAPLDLDPERVSQFVRGVADLTSLEHELSALLVEHDRWQIAHGEIQLVRTDPESVLEELRAAWPRLKDIALPLYEQGAEEWAASLRATGERLEAALEAADPGRARDGFRRYRRGAGIRFFEIDVRLRDLCSNLLTVGEPLVSVLRVLR